MSEEETLALDAMRADNIIDLETRQQYEALNDAAMGDYMSGPDPREISDDWAEVLDVGPTPTSEPQKLLNELQAFIAAQEARYVGAPQGKPPVFDRLYDVLHELSELFLNQK